MAATNEIGIRRVVPRWRNFRVTLDSGELGAAVPSDARGLGGEEFLRQREHEWLEHRSLLFATDLVATSHVLGNSSIAKDAANFVLEDNSNASS